MTEHSPITPPPELVQELYGMPQMRAIEAAFRAGADTELEACCEWMGSRTVVSPSDLRAARRSKPPSLKEQALIALDDADLDAAHENILRRALEQLPDPS